MDWGEARENLLHFHGMATRSTVDWDLHAYGRPRGDGSDPFEPDVERLLQPASGEPQ